VGHLKAPNNLPTVGETPLCEELQVGRKARAQT